MLASPVRFLVVSVSLGSSVFAGLAGTATADSRLDLGRPIVQPLDFPNDKISEHDMVDWKIGAYFTAVTPACHATGNPRFQSVAGEWSQAREWELRGAPPFAENLTLALTDRDHHREFRDPEMIVAPQAHRFPGSFEACKLIKQEASEPSSEPSFGSGYDYARGARTIIEVERITVTIGQRLMPIESALVGGGRRASLAIADGVLRYRPATDGRRPGTSSRPRSGTTA